MIFKNHGYKYIENDLIIIPVNGKIPIVKKWQQQTIPGDIESYLDKYKDSNIGLLTGRCNGIVALDIDTDDKETLKRAPKSPVVKRGRIGETRFFKYNGEKSIKRHSIHIEILSDGNQTVIPPSIHADIGRPYVWLGQELNDIDDLPYLDEKFYNIILNYKAKTKSTVINSDGSRCNHGSHTAISKSLMGKVGDHKTPDTIVTELLEYDSELNPDISYFLCPSRKEWKTSNKTMNAYQFVLNAFSHNNITPLSEKASDIVVIGEVAKEEFKPISYKEKKLPHLRGMMGEFFDYIYNNSPIPRAQLSFASALSTFSTIMGNKAQYNRLLPNLYVLIASPSGYGKNFPLRFPIELFSKSGCSELIGDGSPSSDSALIMNLSSNKVRMDIVDEAAKIFGLLGGSYQKNAFQTKIADVYAELFTSAGGNFIGKKLATRQTDKNPTGTLGACENPYVNFLGAMTIEDFKETFSRKLMSKGLGGRFLYFADDEFKSYKHSSFSEIPQHLLEKVSDIRMGDAEAIDLSGIPRMTTSTRLESKIKEQITEMFNELESIEESDIMKPLRQRKGEIFTKLMMLDALSQGTMTLSVDNFDWALKAVDVIYHNTFVFLNKNLTGGGHERLLNEFENIILQAGIEGISLSNIAIKAKRFGLDKKKRKDIVEDLLDQETIFKTSSKTGSKTFCHRKFIQK